MTGIWKPSEGYLYYTFKCKFLTFGKKDRRKNFVAHPRKKCKAFLTCWPDVISILWIPILEFILRKLFDVFSSPTFDLRLIFKNPIEVGSGNSLVQLLTESIPSPACSSRTFEMECQRRIVARFSHLPIIAIRWMGENLEGICVSHKLPYFLLSFRM